MNDLENKALALANDPRRLRFRLMQARVCLTGELLNGFGRGKLDVRARTLTGKNGIVLEWRLRPFPDEPISYKNQQTAVGSVIVRGELN